MFHGNLEEDVMCYRSTLPHEFMLATYILTILIQMWAWRTANELRKKQTVITMDLAELKDRGLIKTFVPWILFGGLVFFMGWAIQSDVVFDTIVGGFVIMQAATMVLSLETLWAWRMIGNSELIKGSIEYSHAFVMRKQAGQLMMMCLFCLFLFVIVFNFSLLSAAFFMAASAAGSLRRIKK